MHIRSTTRIILSTLLLFSTLTSAISHPTPGTTDFDSAFTSCLHRGIDPYDSIPTDYISHHLATGGYHFLAGSAGALWIQAQSSRQFEPSKRKRELTGYSFATWTSNGGCNGDVVYYPEIYFDKYYWDQSHNRPMNSFQIIKGELDVGVRTIQLQTYVVGTQRCTPIGHRVNGATGCAVGTPSYTCFRVENDPTNHPPRGAVVFTK
ncbi:hypothetical protein BDD12DRAFT_850284 [Trichophaea hybrida]|nr:hypothetical protein BDD12DRAFT_850284 [Trichophaea hybrida]